MQAVQIGNVALIPKTYQKQRVVTFKDIDVVHQRPEGTARKRFNDNQKRFIFGVDYFVRKTDEAKKEFGITAPNGLTLITESGYLMLVKSFTDDLAWKVQRELVNHYFHDKPEQYVDSTLTKRLPHRYQYDGAPVWLIRELQGLFPWNTVGNIRYIVRSNLICGVDYILLEERELAKFKSENTITYPDTDVNMSRGMMVFASGYDKLAKAGRSPSEEKTKRMVVDIPENAKFQKSIAEIRKYSIALDIALNHFNKYADLKVYEARKQALSDLAMGLSNTVFNMLMNQPQLIENKG